MLDEITLGIRRSAASVSADVDKVLLERLLNASTWNHLEVMQDLRLGDLDKRLSNFLSEMKRRYDGVYLDLHGLSLEQRVIASSNAARIGAQYPSSPRWLTTRLPGGEVRISRPERRENGQWMMVIRISIPSQFTEGEIGELVLEFNWAIIQSILDVASDQTRKLMIVDDRGQIVSISGATEIAKKELPLIEWLLPAQAGQLAVRDGHPFLTSPVMVGHERSHGFGSWPGLAWTYVLLQSRDVALAPVHRMAWIFGGLLALATLIIIGVSLLVAGPIARPIAALTAFTRRYGHADSPLTPPTSGPGEIGELTRSFLRMMEDLALSQQTLTQASKLAALGEVTAMLAHDVRTPLGILRSSAQTLAGEPSLSAEGRELLQIIESETNRLNNLVSSLLDSARMRVPQMQNSDVHALIRHAAGLLSTQTRERRVTLELRLQAKAHVVDCDSEQITQVLLNLLMNALQLVTAGGHIEIATHDAPERLFIEVSDNGPGVAPEDRARIFEPFVYKREGGIGLGLAVVRQIVRQHGGDISVDSSSLGGARFRFWLPNRSYVIS